MVWEIRSLLSFLLLYNMTSQTSISAILLYVVFFRVRLLAPTWGARKSLASWADVLLLVVHFFPSNVAKECARSLPWPQRRSAQEARDSVSGFYPLTCPDWWPCQEFKTLTPNGIDLEFMEMHKPPHNYHHHHHHHNMVTFLPSCAPADAMEFIGVRFKHQM